MHIRDLNFKFKFMLRTKSKSTSIKKKIVCGKSIKNKKAILRMTFKNVRLKLW